MGRLEMFIRLLRNTPRQAARLARRQHSRLAQKTSSVLVQQNRYSSSTTAAPYFEVDVVDGGIAIIRMDQPGSPVNTINVSMQDEFASVLDQIENNSDIRSAVLLSKKARPCQPVGRKCSHVLKIRRSHSWRQLTDPPLEVDSNWQWHVTTASPQPLRAPNSACPRSCSAYCLAPAAPNGLS